MDQTWSVDGPRGPGRDPDDGARGQRIRNPASLRDKWLARMDGTSAEYPVDIAVMTRGALKRNLAERLQHPMADRLNGSPNRHKIKFQPPRVRLA